MGSVSYLLPFSSFHICFLLIVFLSDAALDQGAARLVPYPALQLKRSGDFISFK